MEADAGQIPAAFRDLLERPLLAHLATVRADGTPQVSPMWFVWTGRQLLFTSTTRRRKHANITARPWVAVSIADHEAVRHIELRGRISVEPDPRCGLYLQVAERYGDVIDGLPRDAADRVVYRLEPCRVLTFGRRADWSPDPSSRRASSTTN